MSSLNINCNGDRPKKEREKSIILCSFPPFCLYYQIRCETVRSDVKLLLLWIPNFQHHLPFAVHWASLSTAGQQRALTSTAGARRPCRGSVVPVPWWTIARTLPARPLAATTPLNDPCPVKGECRIIREHSESASEQRIAWYKSDQQQQGWVKCPAKVEWSPSLGLNRKDWLLKAVELLVPSEACSHAQMYTCMSPRNWTFKKTEVCPRGTRHKKIAFCRFVLCGTQAWISWSQRWLSIQWVCCADQWSKVRPQVNQEEVPWS